MTSPTVDQDIVVSTLEKGAQGCHETIAMKALVEVIPVQGAQRGIVIAIIRIPGREKMQDTVVRKLPTQRDDIIV